MVGWIECIVMGGVGSDDKRDIAATCCRLGGFMATPNDEDEEATNVPDCDGMVSDMRGTGVVATTCSRRCS